MTAGTLLYLPFDRELVWAMSNAPMELLIDIKWKKKKVPSK
jgi:hypothetical protein